MPAELWAKFCGWDSSMMTRKIISGSFPALFFALIALSCSEPASVVSGNSGSDSVDRMSSESSDLETTTSETTPNNDATGSDGIDSMPVENVNGASWFRSPDGSVEHQMVLVPGGYFSMGSETGYPAESPVHAVHVDSFYIDVFEVTVAQYRECVEAGFCSEPVSAERCEWVEGGPDNHPINCIYWQQAFDYCGWVGLRLPTEAEWEKAARGTDGRTYPWGDGEIDPGLANYKGTNTAKPVGSYPDGVSPYGIHDMSGNVWEWVSDWWDENYYSVTAGDNPKGPGVGEFKVLRSGSWCFLEFSQRSARREPYDPEVTDMDIGFRCAHDQLNTQTGD